MYAEKKSLITDSFYMVKVLKNNNRYLLVIRMLLAATFVFIFEFCTRTDIGCRFLTDLSLCVQTKALVVLGARKMMAFNTCPDKPLNQ